MSSFAAFACLDLNNSDQLELALDCLNEEVGNVSEAYQLTLADAGIRLIVAQWEDHYNLSTGVLKAFNSCDIRRAVVADDNDEWGASHYVLAPSSQGPILIHGVCVVYPENYGEKNPASPEDPAYLRITEELVDPGRNF